MTNNDGGDEEGDNDKNEDGKNDNNAISGLGSDSIIFDPITTPRSLLGLAEEDWSTTMMTLWSWHISTL